ncbi:MULTISPECIES: hypothetical protein [unclassified Corallococcus]|uniref:hypothetical protein n=1 Tax=unclassified Corallococcus TaxID=2685029 RepID=UPI001A8F44DB|nr:MULTISPECIES: hypothetical protein [unclassified Corallococcus]MBN9687139.1 hypothetical protein [Corallococcus sp. NCSPR001]WAS89034.1 hypothetical protein O0N60_19125 [Corallococcus sp. NCRR]
MTTPSDASTSTPAAPPSDDALQYFSYDHLPNTQLRAVSKAFSDLAHALSLGDNAPEAGNVTLGGPVPRCPQRTLALNHLLSAKDAAVRACLPPKRK